MKYRKKRKYKYRLEGDLFYKLPEPPDNDKPYKGIYLCVTMGGQLRIKHGYCWDGPSGPAIDTRKFMRGSLIHDALYQLMREGYLPQSYRKRADEIMREICLEDGMSKIRAWWVYHGVRIGASFAAKPDLLEAP